MRITGLGWSGTRTERAQQLARFYEDTLGLPLVHGEPDFWVFELPDGRPVGVFGPGYPGKAHFDTGPVVGFAVEDLPSAWTSCGTPAWSFSVNPVQPGSTSAALTATSTNSCQADLRSGLHLRPVSDRQADGRAA